MGKKLKVSIMFALCLMGCSAPQVERIQEEDFSQENTTQEEESTQEVQMPKLKFQDIPTTPQEQIIELQ